MEAAVAGEEILPWGPSAAFFDLQRSLGNRVVSRLIEEGGGRPLLAPPRLRPHSGGPARVQRETPNATMPPPNQSVQPTLPAVRNNGITYQGEMLYPDSEKCKATLKKLLAEKGREGASSWGHSMVNPTNEVKAGWSLFADEDYVEQVQGAMRTAVGEFDEECRIFMETFETIAGNTTDAMLINAEEQIRAEQKKLGLQSEVNVDATDRTVSTTYSASNPAYLGEAKSAALALAKKRDIADYRSEKATEARKKAEQQQAMLPRGFDPNSFLPPSTGGPIPIAPVKLGDQTITAIGPVLTDQQLTHKSWREAEDDFKKAAQEATGKYGLLGPLLSGGQGTSERLKSFAAENTAQSGQNLGEQFAEKLANIQTVRNELGERFSIWKQPTIISITHQQMKSGPGEERMVRDKAKQVAEDEKSTKELYAAIALGLGLLAAIPTGGGSLALAGIATAAAVSGAALSAYTAYEESQEYLLQSAAANTSLDRANEISKDEPSFLWLALDIAAAITDLGAAKAACTALRSTIAAAKAAKSATQLPELVGAMRRASISPANQAKVISEVLPSGGDIGKALHDIRQAFIATAKTAADKETAEIMRRVAERALDRGKVIVIPNHKLEAIDVLRKRLAGRGLDVDAKVNEILKDFFAQSANVDGMFYSGEKFIVLRGSQSVESASAVLVHELAHAGQDTMKILESMGTYRSEFEAFKAQQQFLRLLPPEQLAKLEDWPQRLARMNDAQIEEHVLTEYVQYGAAKPYGFDNAAVADGIFNTLFQAGTAK